MKQMQIQIHGRTFPVTVSVPVIAPAATLGQETYQPNKNRHLSRDMSSNQPLFVVYDRQFGNYVRLYENRPDQQRRFLLYDMRSASTFSGDWSTVGESVYNMFYRPIHSNEIISVGRIGRIGSRQNQQNQQIQSPNRMLLDEPEPSQRERQQQQQQQRQQQRERQQVVVRDYSAPQPEGHRRSICPNSLPKFVADLILRNAAAEGARCPITMDPIEETDVFTVTACYHVFNAEALQRWLRERSTCPECNGRL